MSAVWARVSDPGLFCGIDVRIRSNRSASAVPSQFELNVSPASGGSFNAGQSLAVALRALLGVQLLATASLHVRVHAIPYGSLWLRNEGGDQERDTRADEKTSHTDHIVAKGPAKAGHYVCSVRLKPDTTYS